MKGVVHFSHDKIRISLIFGRKKVQYVLKPQTPSFRHCRHPLQKLWKKSRNLPIIPVYSLSGVYQCRVIVQVIFCTFVKKVKAYGAKLPKKLDPCLGGTSNLDSQNLEISNILFHDLFTKTSCFFYLGKSITRFVQMILSQDWTAFIYWVERFTYHRVLYHLYQSLTILLPREYFLVTELNNNIYRPMPTVISVKLGLNLWFSGWGKLFILFVVTI